MGRAIIPLVVGLGIGLVAIKLVFDYVGQAQASGDMDLVEVVVCKQDIPIAMKISREMLSTTEVPRGLLPAQYILAKDLDKVVDRVAAVMLSKGYPVAPAALAPKGTPPGLVVRIPPGYRAIAVKVAEEQQAGGWIVPGVRVDVSAVFTVKGAGSHKVRTVSKVILENIMVAAVGQSLGRETKEPGANVVKSVTLLVHPQDVPKLHYAQTKGKVTFAVRSQTDVASGEMASIDDDEFFADPDSANNGEEKNEPQKEQTQTKNSVFSSLVGAMLTKALMAKAAGPETDQPTPFAVEIINGEEREEKVYVSPWSNEEFKRDDGPFGRKGGARRAAASGLFGNSPNVTIKTCQPMPKEDDETIREDENDNATEESE